MRDIFLGGFLYESEGDSHFSAVRRVVSFPEFGWRGERFTFRDDFSCLRVKFLLLEEYSESGASLGEKACW